MSRRMTALAACGVLAVGLSACENGGNGTPDDADLVAGKQLFVQKCGSCHTMARADTKGVQGPNLDEAFRQSLEEGFGRGGIRGIVAHQIEYPARNLPGDAKNPAYMPKDLVEGGDVRNVASYVAYAAAKKGKDTGYLAVAVKPATSNKPIAAKGGKLDMPADPNGQLAYASTKATATPGKLQVIMKNESSSQHDIDIEGPGVKAEGEVVGQGGTSQVEVDLKPGTYTYFCSVPGHREGGMEGELTVK